MYCLTKKNHLMKLNANNLLFISQLQTFYTSQAKCTPRPKSETLNLHFTIYLHTYGTVTSKITIKKSIFHCYQKYYSVILKKNIFEKQHLLNSYTTFNDFIKAIGMILKSNYFEYKNAFDQQLDGCAMDAAFSSNVAQIFMEVLEEYLIISIQT